jgi:hypothetical protein
MLHMDLRSLLAAVPPPGRVCLRGYNGCPKTSRNGNNRLVVSSAAARYLNYIVKLAGSPLPLGHDTWIQLTWTAGCHTVCRLSLVVCVVAWCSLPLGSPSYRTCHYFHFPLYLHHFLADTIPSRQRTLFFVDFVACDLLCFIPLFHL